MSSAEVLLCTGGYDHTIRLWNVVQGNCTAVLQHNESQVNALSIAPDRSYIAAAGNPCVRIYDPSHSPLLSTCTANYSSSSTSVTASTALHTLNIRGDGEGGEEEQRTNVLSLAFHDPNVLMAASEDGIVRLWDLRISASNARKGGSISHAQLPTRPTGVYLQTEEMRVWYGDGKGRVYCWDLAANKNVFEKSIGGAMEISAITATSNIVLCGDYEGRVWSMHLDNEKAEEVLINTHQGHVTFIGIILLFYFVCRQLT